MVAKPSKKILKKIREYLEKRTDVPVTDADVEEAYYSLFYLAEAIVLFNELNKGVTNV